MSRGKQELALLKNIDKNIQICTDLKKKQMEGLTDKFIEEYYIEREKVENTIKEELEYPGKWDTVAYPDLLSALWEHHSWTRAIHNQKVKEAIPRIIEAIKKQDKLRQKEAGLTVACGCGRCKLPLFVEEDVLEKILKKEFDLK